jgi:hypothetical protein
MADVPHLARTEPERGHPADEGADAAPAHAVDLEPRLLERAQGADVGEAARSAPGEDEPEGTTAQPPRESPDRGGVAVAGLEHVVRSRRRPDAVPPRRPHRLGWEDELSPLRVEPFWQLPASAGGDQEHAVGLPDAEPAPALSSAEQQDVVVRPLEPVDGGAVALAVAGGAIGRAHRPKGSERRP